MRPVLRNAFMYLVVCKMRGHKWRHMPNLHSVCTRCTALKEWELA